MMRGQKITAQLLLQAFALALLCPLVAAVSAPAAGTDGLATCQAGRELRKQTRRVKVTVRDARGHRKRVTRRRAHWACVTDQRAPSRVVGLTAVPGDGSVVLTWTASEDAGGIAGYEIYRDGQYVTTINGTTFTDPNLTPGVAHQYRVLAVDMARNLSSPSGIVWALPKATAAKPPTPSGPDTTPPGVPTGLTATADIAALTVTLKWTAPTDDTAVVSYRIFRDGTLAGTSTTPTFTDTDRSHKTEYKYTVMALDAAGNMSAQTAAVSTYVS